MSKAVALVKVHINTSTIIIQLLDKQIRKEPKYSHSLYSEPNDNSFIEEA